ncbi:hypothetical protein EVAR_47766_1 [Eumeta japonica]|uniref:Uncharacterized protein n=1 Tax=Eumeta variegata TaxID=151549 RepID=A0A4C1XTA9_EUMVA|nr:hypothetical protein EVAR_47766_1 [Eumeta japonica]
MRRLALAANSAATRKWTCSVCEVPHADYRREVAAAAVSRFNERESRRVYRCALWLAPPLSGEDAKPFLRLPGANGLSQLLYPVPMLSSLVSAVKATGYLTDAKSLCPSQREKFTAHLQLSDYDVRLVRQSRHQMAHLKFKRVKGTLSVNDGVPRARRRLEFIITHTAGAGPSAHAPKRRSATARS